MKKFLKNCTALIEEKKIAHANYESLDARLAKIESVLDNRLDCVLDDMRRKLSVLFSEIKKEKTTYQVLEKLEEEIKGIEAYTISTQERQKRYVGNFLLISVGLYVIAFAIFYFLFFPPTWIERITYSVPLLVFPIIIIVLKRLVAWYFQSKLNKNSNKLSNLRAEKKKIIEKVMDKETYKVAIEILNRFNDQPNGHKSQQAIGATLTPYRTPVSPNPTLTTRPQQQSQQRPFITPSGKALTQQSQYVSPIASRQQQLPSTPLNHNRSHNNIGISPANNRLSIPINQQYSIHQQQQQQHHQQQQQHQLQQHPYTPFPIINHNQKGILEKMVDYLIGDGLNSRYGMVCKECFGHNGMTSLEDYEYSAFRCAFCKALNPARKLRPIGPKLAMADGNSSDNSNAPIVSLSGKEQSSTSTSERDSGSDTESSSEPNTKSADEKAPTTGEEPVTTETTELAESVKEPIEEETVESASKSNEEKKND